MSFVMALVHARKADLSCSKEDDCHSSCNFPSARDRTLADSAGPVGRYASCDCDCDCACCDDGTDANIIVLREALHKSGSNDTKQTRTDNATTSKAAIDRENVAMWRNCIAWLPPELRTRDRELWLLNSRIINCLHISDMDACLVFEKFNFEKSVPPQHEREKTKFFATTSPWLFRDWFVRWFMILGKRSHKEAPVYHQFGWIGTRSRQGEVPRELDPPLWDFKTKKSLQKCFSGWLICCLSVS